MLTDILEIHFLELTKLNDNEKINGNGLTDWLMFLKSDSKEVFDMLAKKNKEINKAYDLLKKMSDNKQERYLYEQRQAAISDELTRVEESYEKGWVGGKEEGKEEVIKVMKKKGMTDEEISEITDIDIEIVKSVQI